MLKLLTIDDVAELLRIHRTTVYRLLYQRAINGFPGFKIGSDWRFTPESIDAWIKEQTK